MNTSKQRIASLDGLRAVSIFMVLCAHALGYSHMAHWPAWFTRYSAWTIGYGPFGVNVFFVISGFLITTLLLKEREKQGVISLRNFYIRRAYRILPAAYVVTIAVAIVWHHRVRLSDVVCSLLYVQNYNAHSTFSLGHMWSLAVEEQFYLLWPFLLNRFFRHRYRIVIGAMLIAPLFRASAGWLGFHHQGLEWFPAAMGALATGCLLALLEGKAAEWLGRADTWFFPILIATLAIRHFSYPPGVQPLLMLTLQDLGIAFCIEHCVRKRFWILNWKPVTWIGVLSYSIYLCQQPFLQMEPANIFERLPLNLLCMFAAALVCHYLVEKPFLRLRASRNMATKLLPAEVPA